MTKQNRFGGKTGPRRDRLVQEEIHDTYRSRKKLPEPTRCRGCGAVFRSGRWSWKAEDVADSHETTCPACQRVRDSYPAGYLTISGAFLGKHRDEIVNLARNEATKQSKEHPLKRIMAFEDVDDGLLITTTDPHLARGIGESLARAYEGELDYQYVGDELLRVTWTRDT